MIHEMNLEPGEYWFGDPSYVMRPDDWDDLHRNVLGRAAKIAGLAPLPGCRAMIFQSTVYGDGCYEAFGAEVGVDSGTLAIVPAEFRRSSAAEAEGFKHGAFFTVEKPTTIELHKGDWFMGSKLVCQTS